MESVFAKVLRTWKSPYNHGFLRQFTLIDVTKEITESARNLLRLRELLCKPRNNQRSAVSNRLCKTCQLRPQLAEEWSSQVQLECHVYQYSACRCGWLTCLDVRAKNNVRLISLVRRGSIGWTLLIESILVFKSSRFVLLAVYALFFSLSFESSALSQSLDGQALEIDEIAIPFGWSVGDKRQYSVHQVDYESGNASQVKKNLLKVEILSEGDEFLIAKCNLTTEISPDQQKIIESNPNVKKMLDLYRDLHLLVRIGKDGTLIGLENESDVKVVFQKTVDIAKAAVDLTKLGDDQKVFLDRVVNETTEFTRFRNNLLATLNLMLMVTNTSHSKNEVFQQASTADILYAKGVPTVEKYAIDADGSDQDAVTVVYSRVVEGEKAARLVKAGVEAFMKRLVPNSKEKVNIDGVISKVNGKFKINLANGWPIKIEWRVMLNDLKTGSLKKKQTIKITSIDKPVSLQKNKK